MHFEESPFKAYLYSKSLNPRKSVWDIKSFYVFRHFSGLRSSILELGCSQPEWDPAEPAYQRSGAVRAASQWCSKERIMVYSKLMMVKCQSMMVKWVCDHIFISPSLTSISPSLTSISPSFMSISPPLAWSKPSFAHLTIIEKLQRPLWGKAMLTKSHREWEGHANKKYRVMEGLSHKKSYRLWEGHANKKYRVREGHTNKKYRVREGHTNKKYRVREGHATNKSTWVLKAQNWLHLE